MGLVLSEPFRRMGGAEEFRGDQQSGSLQGLDQKSKIEVEPSALERPNAGQFTAALIINYSSILNNF